MSVATKSLTLNDENFEREVLESTEPVLVDFWADWCQPCHAMAPAIEALAAQFEGSAVVGKLDIVENPTAPGRFGIRSIPSLIFFKNGEEIDRVTGVVSKDVVAKKLKALVARQPEEA